MLQPSRLRSVRLLDPVKEALAQKTSPYFKKKRFRTHTTGLELCISCYEFEIILKAMSP